MIVLVEGKCRKVFFPALFHLAFEGNAILMWLIPLCLKFFQTSCFQDEVTYFIQFISCLISESRFLIWATQVPTTQEKAPNTYISTLLYLLLLLSISQFLLWPSHPPPSEGGMAEAMDGHGELWQTLGQLHSQRGCGSPFLQKRRQGTDLQKNGQWQMNRQWGDHSTQFDCISEDGSIAMADFGEKMAIMIYVCNDTCMGLYEQINRFY